MTVTPSGYDFQDFTSPGGANSVYISKVPILNQANVNTGNLDVSSFSWLTIRVRHTGGPATWVNVNVGTYDAVGGAGVSFNVRTATCLANSDVIMQLPVIGPNVLVQALGDNGAANFNGEILVLGGKGSPDTCQPGILIEYPFQVLGAGATVITNATRTTSGWATLQARGNGGAGPEVLCQVLSPLNAWQDIAGLMVTAAGLHAVVSFKLPPLQTRIAVTNPTGGVIGAGATLMIA